VLFGKRMAGDGESEGAYGMGAMVCAWLGNLKTVLWCSA